MSKPRDVVVARASEKADREDEHFHLPGADRGRQAVGEGRAKRLAASPIPEIDVSGRLPLSKRPACWRRSR
jgi:hypothetical protein